jgi:DNA-binding GntR family transcriptional regulator
MTTLSNDTAAHVEIVDEAASVLRERIFSGRYAPGHLLGQERVAAELGIGRTPTREALRILEQEGLISVDGRRGARVVSADPRRLVAAYQVRGVLDGVAARLAAHQPERHHWLPYLDRLLVEEQTLGVDPHSRALRQTTADFHAAITHMSGNRFLISQLGLVHLTIQVLTPEVLLDETSVRRTLRDHRAVRDSIESGDGTRAEALARQHIEDRIDLLASVDPPATPRADRSDRP